MQDGFSFDTNRHHHLLQYYKALFLVQPPGWFLWLLMGHDGVLATIGIVRKLETVAAKISLALSSTSAPVKRNVKPRSSQQSGWSFSKVSRYHNWFVLNIFFASAVVDSELGVENFVAVLKDLVF